LNQSLNEWKIHQYMSVLNLSLLAELQLKVGKLVISTSSCPSILILENTLNWCLEKCGYGTCGHQYNVSPIHLHALLGVGNIKKAVHLCADGPCCGPRLQKVRETLCYTWCWKYDARHPEADQEATQRRIKKPPRGGSNLGQKEKSQTTFQNSVIRLPSFYRRANKSNTCHYVTKSSLAPK
jgi:hypothetical protein